MEFYDTSNNAWSTFSDCHNNFGYSQASAVCRELRYTASTLSSPWKLSELSSGDIVPFQPSYIFSKNKAECASAGFVVFSFFLFFFLIGCFFFDTQNRNKNNDKQQNKKQ